MGIALGLSLLIVAAVLIRFGFRGRRVGDHPVCAHCEYNLTGRPTDSLRCTECGADLSQPGAIQTGHRVRRQGMLTAGALLILISVLLFRLPDHPLQASLHYLPTWALKTAIRIHLLPREMGDAELQARNRAGTFPTSEWAPLAQQDFLPHQIQIGTRIIIRAGDPIPIALRIGYGSIIPFDGFPDLVSLKIDGKDVPGMNLSASTTVHSGKFSVSNSGWSMAYSVPQISSNTTSTLQPGEHVLTAVLRIHLYNGGDLAGQLNNLQWTDTSKLLSVFDTNSTANFRVIPANDLTGLVTTEPSLAAEVRNAIEVSAHQRPGPGLDFSVIITPPKNVRLAFKVYAHPVGSDSPEVYLGQTNLYGKPTLSPATSVGTANLSTTQPFESDRADVFLRPDIPYAMQSDNPDPVWNQEVIVRDVPIK